MLELILLHFVVTVILTFECLPLGVDIITYKRHYITKKDQLCGGLLSFVKSKEVNSINSICNPCVLTIPFKTHGAL